MFSKERGVSFLFCLCIFSEVTFLNIKSCFLYVLCSSIDLCCMWMHLQVPVKILRGHTDSVTAARLCFSDRRILSCSSDCTAILWVQTNSSGFIGVLTLASCLSVRMLTVSWDKKMVSWDMETGQILWKYQPGGLLTSCSSSSDGRLLVCAADPQNGMYVVDAAGGQIQHHVSDHHRSTITQCRFDPQSQRIATVSEDRSVKLLDLCSHKTTVSIDNAHGNVIANCCFTSDGCFLCTASWDKTLKLWDLHSGGFRCHGGTLLQKGHEGSVSSCSFSADGKLLVSGSYDKTVALWDMPSLCQTVTLKGHSDWVTDVSVSADGKLLASASKDRTIRLWNIENTEDIPQVMKKKTQATGSQIVQVRVHSHTQEKNILCPFTLTFSFHD
uniref:Uncharacterized protein n=1 Tax=Sphaeramia orbicularis TaxID=375764 RepID=A0A672ZEV1_9TELE